MQTLHLRFRALRAISPGQSPSRWQTPSMRSASKWETASPLPNPLGPTLAVGAHPEPSHQRLDRCPTVGAGLTMAALFREPCVGGADAPDTRLVCWSQTARQLSPYPAPHEAGDLGIVDGQARASEMLRTPSAGLSFSIWPAPHNAGAGWKMTADLPANVGALAGVSSSARRQRLRFSSVGR